MIKINVAEFDVLKKSTRNRNSVAKTLSAFLDTEIAKLKINDAIRIDVVDFLSDTDITDVHYYSVLKTLRVRKDVEYKIIMSTSNRCNAIALKRIA